MASAILLANGGGHAPTIEADLAEAGIAVALVEDCTDLVQRAIAAAPDFVICVEQSPSRLLFERIATLQSLAPRPVALFTADQEADRIFEAVAAGVHAYVVNGYDRARLRSVLHLAEARFRREAAVRTELEELKARFDERKLVDRAKGILMGGLQLREEEAFRALRSTAMASRQRLGQVARSVVDAARFSEAMNRAGQVRMLSQRLVLLYALGASGGRVAALFAEAIGQLDATLASLGQALSRRTYGDLLDAVAASWGALRALLAAAPLRARLREADGLAGDLLERAERLTANLEVAAYAAVLHPVNVAGRQRMLCQRLAKEALLDALLGREGPATRLALELEQGLAYLAALPLSNAAIGRDLAEATAFWAALQAMLPRAGADGAGLLRSSEALLGCFERLTGTIERSVQEFVAGPAAAR